MDLINKKLGYLSDNCLGSRLCSFFSILMLTHVCSMSKPTVVGFSVLKGECHPCYALRSVYLYLGVVLCSVMSVAVEVLSGLEKNDPGDVIVT